MTIRELAAMIDHTLLKPEATCDRIDRLCDEAVEHGFATVFVNPIYIERAANRLKNANTVVGSVAGFPLGSNHAQTVIDEARRGVEAGASEIDMVLWVGGLLDRRKEEIVKTIRGAACAVHGAGPRHILKVILEASALTDDQIILGCRCAAEGEADFVKTSTGFHPTGGATVSHVALMHRHASPLRIKASGGIRTLEHATAMIEAGAARIGTSSGVSILRQWQKRSAAT